jgi:hypothetical protein
MVASAELEAAAECFILGLEPRRKLKSRIERLLQNGLLSIPNSLQNAIRSVDLRSMHRR